MLLLLLFLCDLDYDLKNLFDENEKHLLILILTRAESLAHVLHALLIAGHRCQRGVLAYGGRGNREGDGCASDRGGE